METKLVITAVNSISSLGIGYDKIQDGLNGAKNISKVKDFEFHNLDSEKSAYKVTEFDPKEILGKKGLRTKDHSTKLLLSTIELGFKDIIEAETEENRPGLAAGTCFGSVQSIGDFLCDSIENGVQKVNPMLFANTVINSPTGNANIRYDIKTLSATISDGFNSSIDSVIYTCDHIRSGYMPAIIAGGVEEVSYYALLGFDRSGVLSSKEEARPFASDSDGVVMGEGAAFFLIETEESAKAHGRTAIVEIAGYASAFDPADGKVGFNPDGEAAKYVVEQAIKEAGISSADISFVASDASGFLSGDKMEAKVIKEVFGTETPVTAYKANTGECYGASSVINMACAISDMENGKISGTGSKYDTVSDINLVTETIDKKSDYVAITAFSFDGNVAALILKNVN